MIPRKLSTVLPAVPVRKPPLQRTPRLLPITPRLLRIPEAAVYIGATNWFVEELIRKQKIRYLILGKIYVLDTKDLDNWIDAEKLRQSAGCGVAA